MTAPDEPKKGSARPRPSHLSHSRLNRYLHCPEQYRLYYIENLRPRFPAASLVFGQVLHQALAELFKTGSDPLQSFLQLWSEAKEADLTYGGRESWEKLEAAGRGLLEKFLKDELPRLRSIEGVERGFELDITTLDLPFVGVIDLVAEVDGKRTVVDFKTSGSAYEEHEAPLSDQLTAYQLAEPEAEQAALCVFVKTKEPKIEWCLTTRTGDQLAEYLAKARLVTREITAGHFYKRAGKWCSWCDYLPVCTGDIARARQELTRLSARE